MRHYPVFLDLDGRRVVVAGAGETAAAKLRLLCKTGARLRVIGEDPADAVRALADAGAITLETRPFTPEDAEWAALLYAAHDDPARDAAAASAGRAAGALVNVVDDLEASDFITPAIVDRDPVTVAIGTEGTAPVLARDLKARIEAMLPAQTGALARIAALFRDAAARLPKGRARRAFWRRYFSGEGAAAYAQDGEAGARRLLSRMLGEETAAQPGAVALIGAGPGDPDLLTLRARTRLHDADVVIHDPRVDPRILELARREAQFIPLEEIAAAARADRHAQAGALVAWLVPGAGDGALTGTMKTAPEIIPGVAIQENAAALWARSLPLGADAPVIRRA